ncbi:MAG: BON domain-containing protein [Pyrinomonadaceae bacterium]
MRTFKHKIIALATILVITASSAMAATTGAPVESGNYERVAKQVRHELVTLPYYGVFDNLSYQINGGTVTLSGQVVRPTTRSEAARRVAKLAGVSRVVNNIEVLPLSTFDDSIRARTYRSVFNTASLYRYALGNNPSLHIVVNRGHVTLEGVVANEGDRRFAYSAAMGVPGVFSVTNNLRTDREARAY